jgi:hypothetical protein
VGGLVTCPWLCMAVHGCAEAWVEAADGV